MKQYYYFTDSEPISVNVQLFSTIDPWQLKFQQAREQIHREIDMMFDQLLFYIDMQHYTLLNYNRYDSISEIKSDIEDMFKPLTEPIKI